MALRLDSSTLIACTQISKSGSSGKPKESPASEWDFFANPTKRTTISNHELRRREWRAEAKACQQVNLTELKESDIFSHRERFKSPRSTIRGNTANRERTILNKTRILKAISQWPEDEEYGSEAKTTSPPVANNSDSDYEVKAYIMNFKKEFWGYIGMREDPTERIGDRKIPMNQLLTKSENNPLNEHCPPNRLRYIHVPTNNMAWIEVSPSFQISLFWPMNSKSLRVTITRVV